MSSGRCNRLSRCGIVNHMVKSFDFPGKMGVTNRDIVHEPEPGQVARSIIASSTPTNETVQTTARCAQRHGRLNYCAARTRPIYCAQSCQAVTASRGTASSDCRSLRAGGVLGPRGTTIVRYISESQVPRAISQDPKPTGSLLSSPYWHHSRYGHRQRGAGA
jgi:hypothetical protein